MSADIIGVGRSLKSLGEAIGEAGGGIFYQDLLKMSALDLVKMCGHNDIIFVYDIGVHRERKS